MALYGSIHTHFEDLYDAVNSPLDSILEFVKAGATKVAATGHGVFAEYEDLKAVTDQMHKFGKALKTHIENTGITGGQSQPYDDKEPVWNIVFADVSHPDKAEEIANKIIANFPDVSISSIAQKLLDFEIVPGVEAYFGEEKDHLILIAKDYEGYKSLSKILTQAAVDSQTETPIVTMDNLKQNVSKGHIICTSACIAGPLGKRLALIEDKAKKTIAKEQAVLDAIGFKDRVYGNNITEVIEPGTEFLAQEYAELKEEKKNIPTKTEIKELKNTYGADSEEYLNAVAIREDWEKDGAEKLKTLKEEYKNAEEIMKKASKRLQKIEDSRMIISEESKNKRYKEAESIYMDFKQIFGDDFYFEIQNHDIPVEADVYNAVIKFAIDHGETTDKFIASNDIHLCVRQSSPEYEKALTRRSVAQYQRFNTYKPQNPDDREYTIKSDGEISEWLARIIEPYNDISAENIINAAIKNTKTVLENCHIEYPEQSHYPMFAENADSMLENLCKEGLQRKMGANSYGEISAEYRERLERELGVIKQMGYASYHLIVQDYLKYASLLGFVPSERLAEAPLNVDDLDRWITREGFERIGLGIGPGRGSAAGSLCCYALGITDIDPIKHKLLFERFLNPERVSMPDIDSDFGSDVRNKTIEYVKARYGEDRVCRIITKSYSDAKGSLRLAARYLAGKAIYEKTLSTLGNRNTQDYIAEDENALDSIEGGLSGKEKDEIKKAYTIIGNKLAKLYAEQETKGGSRQEIYDAIKELSSPQENLVVELAQKLDGIITNYGQHAAGVIISADPLNEIIPLIKNKEDLTLETQCTMEQAEAKGLLKMDFLGLENLDIITDIVRHPSDKNDPLDDTLNVVSKKEAAFDDPTVYKDIYARGVTQGVFQFESPGMKRMLRDFKPESFADIVLLVAAYRPGPMAFIDEMTKKKWFEKDKAEYEKRYKTTEPPKSSITTKCAALDAILAPTYGCPIYQEQIMQIFQDMAGYSLGGADVVRRYMSKKKADKLAYEKETFIHGDPTRNIPGCMKKQGLSEQEASELFEQLMPFAAYGFNKSHAAAYAYVSFCTAYLKETHTGDFYRTSIQRTTKNDDIEAFADEALKFYNIRLSTPTLANKDTFYDKDSNRIALGYSKIKGVKNVDVVSTNESGAPIRSVQEFIKANPSVDNSVVLSFAKVGMFDSVWKTSPHMDRKTLVGYTEYLTPYFKNLATLDPEADSVRIQNVKDFLNYTYADFCLHRNSKSFIKEPSEEALAPITLKREGKEDVTIKFPTFGPADYTNIDNIIMSPNYDDSTDCFMWEKDLLGVSTSLDKKIAKLKETYPNCNKTSNDLEDLSKGATIPVACIVTEKTPGKTKNGNPYIEAKLVDINGVTFTRRFKNEPPDMGVFKLYGENDRYFLSDTSIPEDVKKDSANTRVEQNKKEEETGENERC